MHPMSTAFASSCPMPWLGRLLMRLVSRHRTGWEDYTPNIERRARRQGVWTGQERRAA